MIWQLIPIIVLSHWSANLGVYLLVVLWRRKSRSTDDAVEVVHEPSPALLAYCEEKGLCPECARPLIDHAAEPEH